MSSRSKYILYLLIIGALLAVSIGIFVSRTERKAAGNKIPARISQEQLAADYQKGVRIVLADYDRLMAKENYSLDEILSLKDEFLKLTVPAEFKDPHVGIVLALTKIEDSFHQDSENLRDEGRKKILEIRASYDW